MSDVEDMAVQSVFCPECGKNMISAPAGYIETHPYIEISSELKVVLDDIEI